MKITRVLPAFLFFGTILPFASASDYKVLPFQYADVTGEWGDPVSPTVVSAQWRNKQGISGNPSDFGLVLTKQTGTSTAASSGAAIKGPEGDVVVEGMVFGYSHKNDSWCGAGAPRFNIKVSNGEGKATYAVGCGNTASSTTPTNDNWTTKTWVVGQATFYPLNGDTDKVPLIGSTIVSVVIVFDEGTDVGPGTATLDDIQYNKVLIGDPARTN